MNNKTHFYWIWATTFLLIAPLYVRAIGPTKLTPIPRVKGYMRMVVIVHGPGGRVVIPTANKPNGDGELIPKARNDYITSEDIDYRIGVPFTPYQRATGPIVGPTKAVDCAGLVLYELSRSNLMQSPAALPMMNVKADNVARILNTFAPKECQEPAAKYDIVFWAQDPLSHSSSHVSYVSDIVKGKNQMVITTKDQAQSILWRTGNKLEKGTFEQESNDFLIVVYKRGRRYRLPPGLTIRWNYWRPNWTTNKSEDPAVTGVTLVGTWGGLDESDKLYKRYQIELASSPHELPLVFRDLSSGRVAYGGFEGPNIIYRNEWGSRKDAHMKYQASFTADDIRWTNRVDRDENGDLPSYKPVTWRRASKGTVTYSGQWLTFYGNEDHTKSTYSTATTGREWHFGRGEYQSLRVTKQLARVVIDLSTGQVSGELEYERAAGDKDPFIWREHADFTNARIDPIAYQQQRGADYVRLLNGPSLHFYRDVNVQPPGWPSLGNDFILYNVSKVPTVEELRTGQVSGLTGAFCVLSLQGNRPPTSGSTSTGGAGPSAAQPVDQQQINQILAQGKPAIYAREVSRKPGTFGRTATVADGTTGFVSTLLANRFIQPKSVIETGGDTVHLTIVLPGGGEARERTVDVKLSASTKFDVGDYFATQRALEFFLVDGLADIKTNAALRASAQVAVKLTTPTAVITNIKTDYSVKVDGATGETDVKVREGQVEATPKNKSLDPLRVEVGQQVKITENQIKRTDPNETSQLSHQGEPIHRRPVEPGDRPLIIALEGQVYGIVIRPNQSPLYITPKWMKVGLTLPPGGGVIVHGKGMVKIRHLDGTIVTVGSDSRMILPMPPAPPSNEPSMFHKLIRGSMRCIKEYIRETFSFGVETNTVMASPTGTDFRMIHDDKTNTTTCQVFEGSVMIQPKNPALASFTLPAGKQVTVTLTEVGPIVPIDPTMTGEPSGESQTTSVPATVTHVPAGITVGSGPYLPGISGTPSTLNTLVYHQITTDDSIAGHSFPVLSDSGNRIVFASGTKPCTIWAIDPSGSNRKRVMQTDSPPSELDISANGSRVMVNNLSRQIFSVNANGSSQQRLVWTHDPEISTARLSGDGRRVYFLLSRDAPLNDAPQRSPSGLWVVNTDGSGLRHIVGQNQMRTLLRIASNEAVTFNRQSLDVSNDGRRIVFGVVSYSKTNAGPKIFTVHDDGQELRMVAQGTKDSRGAVGHVAITAKGNLVAYKMASWGQKNLVGVVNTDGRYNRVISSMDSRYRYPDGNTMQDPLTFSGDNRWLLLGSTGILLMTDGSDIAYHLAATRTGAGKVIMNGGLLRATMDRSARKFAFLCNDERNSRELKKRVQIGTLQINPLKLGAAPRISDVQIDPHYLIPQKNALTIKANVQVPNQLIVVSNVATYKGLAHDAIAQGILLDDGGRSGDEIADDGVYTNKRIHAVSRVELGLHNIRVDAESQGDDSRRHATVVEIGPIPVTLQPPTKSVFPPEEGPNVMTSLRLPVSVAAPSMLNTLVYHRK